jgi:hypothetical protein
MTPAEIVSNPMFGFFAIVGLALLVSGFIVWRLFTTDPVAAPLQALLFCPFCHAQHVDEGVWSSRAHHTHLCAKCRGVWRVEPYVIGVRRVKVDPAVRPWPPDVGQRPPE